MFSKVRRSDTTLVYAQSAVEGNTLTPSSDRETASELAKRLKSAMIDPSKVDEADRPPGDRPPGFADMLMSEKPVSVEHGADLTDADWQLIVTALESYARSGTG
jgi:hypothetical protein